MENTLAKQEQTKVEKDFKPLLAEVKECTERPVPEITNAELESAVAFDAIETRKLWEKVEKRRKYFTSPLSDLINLINRIAKPAMTSLEKREEECDRAIRKYRNQIEDERKAREAAARAAIERENERIRREQEAAARKKEAEARKAKDAETAQQKTLEAEQIRSNVVYIPPPVVPSEKSKLDSIQTRKIWKCRIIDAAAVPHQYRKCEPNMTVLNALAKTSGAQYQGSNRIAGVEFYCEEIYAKSGTKAGEE